MRLLSVLLVCLILAPPAAGISPDSLIVVRGLAIVAPNVEHVDEFVRFMEDELVRRGVNTLVLRVGYNFEYESHPELRNDQAPA